MKRWLLTVPVLLAGMTAPVQADYFFIVINTGSPPPSNTGTGTGTGMMGMGMQTQTPTTLNLEDFVGAIVETENQQPFTKNHKVQFDKYVPQAIKWRNYNLHLSRYSGPPGPVPVNPPVFSFSQVSLYNFTEKTDSNPNEVRTRGNVHRLFEQKRDDKKTKLPPLELAEWALTHGLLDRYVETMDKLAMDEKEKENPAVVSYLKVKKAIATKLDRDPESPWVRRLKDAAFKTETSDHYILWHNILLKKDEGDIKPRLDRLEEAFKTFYYWDALKWSAMRGGKTLPLPRERLVVVLGKNEDDDALKEFRAITDGYEGRLNARHEDGFYARREGILYLSLTSREPNYEKLSAFASNKLSKLMPKQLVVEDVLAINSKKPIILDGADFGAVCLAVKVLEEDALRATISHHASRQLAFASEMMPRYVAVPEWFQFGVGSFFETPHGSPWASPAGLSSLHLKTCQDFLEKQNGPALAETLKQVVTDGYFHLVDAIPEGTKHDEESKKALAKARALSWGLVFYLAQMKPELLKSYSEELNKLPHDLPLDADVLVLTFARLIGAVDGNRKVDPKKMTEWAGKWKEYMQQNTSEGAALTAALKENIESYKTALTPKQ